MGTSITLYTADMEIRTAQGKALPMKERPVIRWREQVEFTLSPASGAFDSGEYFYAFDTDRAFLDTMPCNAGECDVVEGALKFTVLFNSERQAEQTNRRSYPIPFYIQVTRKHDNEDGTSFYDYILDDSIHVDGCVWDGSGAPGLPANEYYTKKEIDGIVSDMDDKVSEASGYADEAKGAKNDAIDARDAAISAKNDAVSAKNDAVTAKNDAVSAKNDAVTAKNDAQTALANAIAAKNDAITAKDGAVGARNDAQAALANAIQAKNDAIDARNDARASKTDAAQSASDSANSALDASNKAYTISENIDAALNAAQSAAADALVIANYVALSQTAKQDVETVHRLKDETQALYDSIMVIVAEYYIGPAYGYGLTVDGTQVAFTWTDPADNDVVKWAKTRLICKSGGFPADETDGTILVDSVVRNQYKTSPFYHDFGSSGSLYFALFTQSTGGRWNTGDDAPRFTTDVLTWATIGMLSRSGSLLTYPNMAIGAKIDLPVNSLYKRLRYKLAHIDYAGSYATIGEYMQDNTKHHNSIWIPDYMPGLGDGFEASRIQFDASETEYGATLDEEFLTGKAYYVLNDNETYSSLVAGTDYTTGGSVADWQDAHGETVFTKNDSRRRNYGYNRWSESNMRQWLNSTGDNWFAKQNEYDVKSANADYGAGWLTGIDAGFLEQVMPVHNKTVRNSVAILDGGAGGGSDITLDRFWLPSRTEVFDALNGSTREGRQFTYFADVATTDAQRRQYGEDGNVVGMWLRSTFISNTNALYYVSTGGISSTANANSAFAFIPVVCLA